MHYRKEDGFEMREVTDEEFFEALSLHRWSAAYALLGLIAVGFAIFFMFKGRWGYSILIWILGQVCISYGGVLHQRAHEVLDD